MLSVVVVRSLLRRSLPLVALGLALLQAEPVAAAIPPACDLHWQVSLPADSAAPIGLTLTFDAGPRNRTELRLPEGSEIGLLADAGTPALEPVPGRPLARSVLHRPGDRVSLRFMIMPGPTAWLHRSAGGLMFVATALLPRPTEPGPWQMCLALDGLADDAPLQANLGQAAAGDRLLRLQGPPSLLRDWLVAAGPLQPTPALPDGQRLHVVLPAGTPAPLEAGTVSEAAERQLGLVRRLWQEGPGTEAADRERAGPWPWLMLWPGPADTPARGLALQHAMVLQVPVPGAPGELDAALLHTVLQVWLRARFGPVAFEPRRDDRQTAWFWDGFSQFYLQRLRSATAQHSLQAHADALSALLQPDGTGATPWLAMRWHTALRAEGRPGLDPVLQRLLVPAAQARSTGPLSSPLAPHRLQAALRPLLAQAPSTDLQQLTGRPALTALTPEVLGPCFRVDAAAQRIQPASEGEPSEACRGWLDGSAPAVAAAARPDRVSKKAAAQPGKAKKAGKASAKPVRKTPSKAAPKASRRPAA